MPLALAHDNRALHHVWGWHGDIHGIGHVSFTPVAMRNSRLDASRPAPWAWVLGLSTVLACVACCFADTSVVATAVGASGAVTPHQSVVRGNGGDGGAGGVKIGSPGGRHLVPPGQRVNMSSCHISCSSTDGIGHQFGSKLSCVLVGSITGAKYLHTPVSNVEHIVNATAADYSAFEAFLGLGSVFPLVSHARSSGMAVRRRFAQNANGVPVPPLNPKAGYTCLDQNWFWQVHAGLTTCAPDTIHVADNCLRAVACLDNITSLPGYQRGLDIIRGAYWLHSKPHLDWFAESGAPSAVNVPAHFSHNPAAWSHIVVHIRRGDARFRYLRPAYYEAACGRAVEELRARGMPPPWIHVETDATSFDEFRGLGRYGPVTFTGDDESVHTILRAIHRMTMADALIASDSSLSAQTAPLLREAIQPGRITIVRTCDRPGAQMMMLRGPWIHFQYCKKPGFGHYQHRGRTPAPATKQPAASGQHNTQRKGQQPRRVDTRSAKARSSKPAAPPTPRRTRPGRQRGPWRHSRQKGRGLSSRRVPHEPSRGASNMRAEQRSRVPRPPTTEVNGGPTTGVAPDQGAGRER